MTVKSLSTQFNEIVFLSHIRSIRIEDADTYFKSVGYPIISNRSMNLYS